MVVEWGVVSGARVDIDDIDAFANLLKEDDHKDSRRQTTS